MNDNGRKIGIFGGTFDPMHLGHLKLAESACAGFNLEKMLIMPTPAPYHRTDKKVSDLNHRIDMVKMTIEDSPQLEFSDFEINLPGPTYTVNTLKALKNSYPGTEFYMVVGGDSLFSMEMWYKPAEIFDLAVVLSSPRKGQRLGASGNCRPDAAEDGASVCMDEEFNRQADRLRKLYGARIYNIEMPAVDISSSDIVSRVKNGLSISGMVKKSVEEYIYSNGLYV